MIEIIDAAFLKNNGEAVELRSKGIQDASFIYLLTKETKKVVKLNLCTY